MARNKKYQEEEFTADGYPADAGFDATDEANDGQPIDVAEEAVSSEELGTGHHPREQKSAVGAFFLSILSGNILSKAEVKRAYPYVIILCVIAFIYIATVFRTQYLYREHLRLTEQVKELRARSMTIASQKMIATRQSNIMREIEQRGIPLQESLRPNKIIPR